MTLDEKLASRFHCPKCRNHGAITKRFAATGTGLSKILDIQHNKYIGVSCRQCGFTEFYNPGILEKSGQIGNIMDIIFGG